MNFSKLLIKCLALSIFHLNFFDHSSLFAKSIVVSLSYSRRFRFIATILLEDFFELLIQIDFKYGKNELSRPHPDPLKEICFSVAM